MPEGRSSKLLLVVLPSLLVVAEVGCGGGDELLASADAAPLPDMAPPPMSDASPFPEGIGTLCDPRNSAGVCPGECLQGTFFGCQASGFCTRSCDDDRPCPTRTVCAALPLLDGSGMPTLVRQCFLPCVDGGCPDPDRLSCEPTRKLCGGDMYWGNVGTLGARRPDGTACVDGAPPVAASRFGANVPVTGVEEYWVSEPHVVVASDEHGETIYAAYNSLAGTTVVVSTDGGATFAHHAIGNVDPEDRGDPVLALDPTSHDVWHVYLSGGQAQCGSTLNEIRVVYSAAGGDDWHGPIQVNDPAYTSNEYFLDKPWLTVGPDGSLYVTFTAFYSSVRGEYRTDVVMASSHDHGASWSNVVVSGDEADGSLTRVVVDAAGTVYLSWVTSRESSPGTYAGVVAMTRSLDGGATVEAPIIVASPGLDVAYDDPQLAALPDGSAVHVVFSAAVPGGGADANDVMATVSADGGATWAPVVKLNDDPSCATHGHPASTLDATGALWTTWYDGRYGDGRVRWTKSRVEDGAIVVVESGWVTDGAQPLTTSRYSFFVGDYMGLTTAGNRLYAVWGDLRDAARVGGARIYLASGPTE